MRRRLPFLSAPIVFTVGIWPLWNHLFSPMRLKGFLTVYSVFAWGMFFARASRRAVFIFTSASLLVLTGVFSVLVTSGLVDVRLMSSTLMLNSRPFNVADPDMFSRRGPGRPLRVLTSNPRYFTHDNGAAVYLTGSHVWTNFQEPTPNADRPRLDYDAYLATLRRNGHNFIRLWAWEDMRHTPLPYLRTGPGTARDGGHRFNVNQFDQSYFDRLRDRCLRARERGIYVAVMLFQGWSVARKTPTWNPWQWHPFHRRNNVNGVDGDPDNSDDGQSVHSVQIPDITARQKAYVEKVIDTVNDLDNVLYEISNESPHNSVSWHYELIRHIKRYQAGRPMQHPVGMTAVADNADLYKSPADWISPSGWSPAGPVAYADGRPIADGRKVILLDTDHIWGLGGDSDWVWRSFTSGHNPIFMDSAPPLSNEGLPGVEATRVAMGATAAYARRMDLAKMTPRGDLTSTGYALVNPAVEYLVYQSDAEPFLVRLVSGTYAVEWYAPTSNRVIPAGTVTDAKTAFRAPFAGQAVLYLKRQGPDALRER